MKKAESGVVPDKLDKLYSKFQLSRAAAEARA